MSAPLALPASLGDDTLETLLLAARRSPGDDAGPVLDARGVTFVDPHGLLGLLEFGRLCDRLDHKARLLLPDSEDVTRYLHRMNFFEFARRVFLLEIPTVPRASASGLRGTATDVLLEITPIEHSRDIHTIVGRVRERAGAILAKYLKFDDRARDRFLVALSEVCQNITEHSEDRGYVAIQKYFYRERLAKNVVKIAVTDLGIGVRQSLGSRLATRFGATWSDATAIRQALFHAQSRFDDPGRGHGLRAVRDLTQQWRGRLVMRSGSARLGVIPVWGRGRAEVRGLPHFPGTQVWLTLPEAD